MNSMVFLNIARHGRLAHCALMGAGLIAALSLAVPVQAQTVIPPVVPATPSPATPAPATPAPATPAAPAVPAAPAPATSAPQPPAPQPVVPATSPPAAPADSDAPQPPAEDKPKPVVKKRPPPPPTVTAISTDPQPTYTPRTIEQTQAALAKYRSIAASGGWPQLPAGVKLSKGAKGAVVATLTQRLAIEGDLPAEYVGSTVFDDHVVQAVKRFQRRVGLVPSGLVAAATLRSMNVSAEQRVTALEKSLERLADSRFQFGERYVIVNIPALAAEAVEQNEVARRHVVIVGKPDRASPMVETRLTVVNFNPTWTVPTSLIKKDIIPKMRKNPATLASMRIRVLDRSGQEVPASAIDWSTERAVNYTLRQDPGPGNSLGRVRIDMPNREAVFMHDTPSRRLFQGDARYLSSGCVRVGDVESFVTWLLAPQGWEKPTVTAAMTITDRKDVRLSKGVPVAWVYLTGWASSDGTVHFRDDIYGYDMLQVQPKVVRAGEKPAALGPDGLPIDAVPLQPQQQPEAQNGNWLKKLFPGQQSQPAGQPHQLTPQ